MKGIKIIVAALTIVMMSSFTFDLITAQGIAKATVEKYLKSFQDIFQLGGGDVSNEFRGILGTIVCQNDLEIDVPTNGIIGTVKLGDFVTKFSTAVKTKQISKYEYNILKNEPFFSEAAYNSAKKETTYIQTSVKVTIGNNVYSNFFLTNVGSGKGVITKIGDKYFLSSSNFQNDKKESVEYIRIIAAQNYTNGKFDVAYQKYLELVKQEPDGDAYYRLGVMTYFKEGCANLFANSKERYKKVDEFLDLAIENGSPEISKKAKYMKYNIQ